VTPYVPPGWPAGVHPPSSPDFERSAIGWLLSTVPPDYVLHGVLRRHPVALATLARHHLGACVEGARNGYRTARAELGPHLPPAAVEAVLTAYRSEGKRLAETARAANLVERALRGEVFVRQISGGRAAKGQRDVRANPQPPAPRQPRQPRQSQYRQPGQPAPS
jgi:hypothetical protein